MFLIVSTSHSASWFHVSLSMVGSSELVLDIRWLCPPKVKRQRACLMCVPPQVVCPWVVDENGAIDGARQGTGAVPDKKIPHVHTCHTKKSFSLSQIYMYVIDDAFRRTLLVTFRVVKNSRRVIRVIIHWGLTATHATWQQSLGLILPRASRRK